MTGFRPPSFSRALCAGAAGITFAEVVVTGSLDVRVPLLSGALTALAGLAVIYLVLGPPGTRLRHRSMPIPKSQSALFAGFVGGIAFILVSMLSRIESDPAAMVIPRPIVAPLALAGAGIVVGFPLYALLRHTRRELEKRTTRRR